MAAYIIIDIDVTDPNGYEGYKKLSAASLGKYSGKFIVRGGKTETLEGNWKSGRIVVIEFPDADCAKQWWHSNEYAPAKLIRYQTANSRMILVDGVG